MPDEKKNINIKNILRNINGLAEKIGHRVNLMEVCGTHTQTAARYGIRQVLPENVRLITGPGCPVCVTDQYDIDCVIELALSGVPLAVYGDVLRVPGSKISLEKTRAKGAKVFVVYSTEDALALKVKYPELVFFGLGFETTAPMSASAVKRGLTVYSTHKFFVPAMSALLAMGEIKIDGFIGPGHVSAIIGMNPYYKLGVPLVVSGFTGEDMLRGIMMLLDQIASGRCEVENQYSRVVRFDGNQKAFEIIDDVFERGDSFWRGFGLILGSGMLIKSEYAEFNALEKYKDIISKINPDASRKFRGCKCGDIIRALLEPEQCPLFGKSCTPQNPYGPCMVSAEGACNVKFRY